MPILTPEQKVARQKRRDREATYPKCSCGNTLGQERARIGMTKCRGCLPDDELVERDLLAKLEDRAIMATTFEELQGVVVDIVGRMRHAHKS